MLAVAAPATAQTGVTTPGQTQRSTAIAFTLGGGYSDNLLRDTVGGVSGSYTAPGVVVDLARDSQRVRAVANGNVEYRNYSVSSVSNETFGTLDAELEVRLVPERFSWLFTDNFDQGRSDAFSPTGPDNREQINIFSTGPAVSLPFNERTSMRMQATTGQRSYADTSQLDSDTFSTELGFYRRLRSTTEVGIAASSREVDYDIDAFDNQIDTIFAIYRSRFSSGDVSVAVGQNKVAFGTRDDSSAYFNAAWARDVGARSRLNIDIANQLADAGDSFRGGRALQDEIITFDVYERSSAGLSLTVTQARSRVVLSGRIGEDSYKNAIAFDNDYIQVGIDYERQLANAMQFGADLTLAQRDYAVTLQKDDDTGVGFWISRNFSEQLSLRAEVTRDSRGGGNTFTFDETAIWFHLRFDLNSRAANNGA
jgi:hypothetical protein